MLLAHLQPEFTITNPILYVWAIFFSGQTKWASLHLFNYENQLFIYFRYKSIIWLKFTKCFTGDDKEEKKQQDRKQIKWIYYHADDRMLLWGQTKSAFWLAKIYWFGQHKYEPRSIFNKSCMIEIAEKIGWRYRNTHFIYAH